MPGFCAQLSGSRAFAGRRMPFLPGTCQRIQTHLVVAGGIRTPQSSFLPAQKELGGW